MVLIKWNSSGETVSQLLPGNGWERKRGESKLIVIALKPWMPFIWFNHSVLSHFFYRISPFHLIHTEPVCVSNNRSKTTNTLSNELCDVDVSVMCHIHKSLQTPYNCSVLQVTLWWLLTDTGYTVCQYCWLYGKTIWKENQRNCTPTKGEMRTCIHSRDFMCEQYGGLGTGTKSAR